MKTINNSRSPFSAENNSKIPNVNRWTDTISNKMDNDAMPMRHLCVCVTCADRLIIISAMSDCNTIPTPYRSRCNFTMSKFKAKNALIRVLVIWSNSHILHNNLPMRRIHIFIFARTSINSNSRKQLQTPEKLNLNEFDENARPICYKHNIAKRKQMIWAEI